MMRYKKIQAGALQFVLFIGAVIAVLLFTFVILNQTHTFFGKQATKTIAVVKKADTGLQYAIKNPLKPSDSTALQVNEEDGIQLKAIKEYWGAYEKYTVVSTFKKNRFTRMALVGGGFLQDTPALYLQDNERPVIIVGSAQIIGDAYLPKQGIRPGNISGQSYYSNSLVYGQQRQSTPLLPELNGELRNHMVNLTKNTMASSQIDVMPLADNLVFSNSFASPTKYVFGDVIDLRGVGLTGNIIVKASRRIIVDASSSLTDIILSAPEIDIKNGTKGNFQAFAQKKISVGKNCFLDYPSALVVHNASQKSNTTLQDRTPNIFIDSNSIIKGSICYLSSNPEQQYAPQVSMNKSSALYGELYCEKNLELKGSVIGKVSTHSFIAMENGSIYQNHLFNGVIDRTLLPEQYVGLVSKQNEQQKEVTKWLY